MTHREAPNDGSEGVPHPEGIARSLAGDVDLPFVLLEDPEELLGVVVDLEFLNDLPVLIEDLDLALSLAQVDAGEELHGCVSFPLPGAIVA